MSIGTRLRELAARLYPTHDEKYLTSRIASLVGDVPPREELVAIVKEAWETGQTVELSGVAYGPPHWPSKERIDTRRFPYYYFLAGLVRSQNCSRILEIGTHYGGSATAMSRGSKHGSKLVTIDMTTVAPPLPGITKLTGDANTEKILLNVFLEFDGKPIDLIYIDATHKTFPTLQNVCLYAFLLKPRFVVFDDITLNEEMRKFWWLMRAAYGSRCLNCVDVVPIERDIPGFGILYLC